MKSSRTTVRFSLLRWHRRVGLLIALFALILSITGMLLNHTEELSLDSQYIDSEWLLEWYGVESPETVSFQVGEQWISGRESALYLDSQTIQPCAGDLAGAIAHEDELLIACRDALLLLTRSGQIIERVDATLGLPVPVDFLGTNDGSALLQSAGKIFAIDLDELRFSEVSGVSLRAVKPQSAPQAILDAIQSQSDGHSIHWERVLLDLHSGRLFGRAGVYIFDLAALLLIFLALSGVYYWASKPGSRR